MTAVSQPLVSAPTTIRRPPRRFRHTLDRWFLPGFTVLAIGYLLIPIVVMIIFSFNDYQGKFNFVWHGFTLQGWLHPFDWPGLPDAIKTSLLIAALSTIGSTILGTFIGLALTRYNFRGRGAINGLIFLPMATPEIVMGSSLLTLFVNSGLQGGMLNGIVPKGVLFPLGFTTILIAHIMFNISYVVVTVKSRIRSAPRGGGDGPRRRRADDVLEGHLPADLPRRAGRRPARLLAVDRRLHHHQLRVGHDQHVPDLGLQHHQERPAGADQRGRLDGLPGRRPDRRPVEHPAGPREPGVGRDG